VLGALDGREVVFHLGALIPIPYSYRHPREFVAANVVGTLNILEAARRLGSDRVIHTSTSEVYGTPLTVPITEKHALNAQSPYAASKVGADQLALSYQRSFGTPVVVVRPFNTYGPRQSARGVIPTVIAQALGRVRIELGSTETTRDFLYVGDTVAGFLAAGDAPAVEGEVMNLGTGVEISVAEVVARVVALTGTTARLETAADRLRPPLSEVERLVADTAKAQHLLGWRPTVAFDDGLRDTIEWMRGALESYKASLYNV
jgi:dTDP-glucose 4,6-dehydratase